jgi:hypothetical protein
MLSIPEACAKVLAGEALFVTVEDVRGCALGRLFPKDDGSWWWNPEGTTKQFPLKPQRRAQRKKLVVVYDDLPQAMHLDGECPRCRHFPNYQMIQIKTDQGQKSVIKCTNCEALIRPKTIL